MDEILIPVGVVASSLGIDAGEFAKLVKTGAPDADNQKAIADFIANHWTTTLARTKEGAFDEGHGKATREVLTAKERDIKNRYPALTGKNIDELFDNATKMTGATDWTKDPTVAKELKDREDKIVAKDQELAAANQKFARELATFKMKSVVPGILTEAGYTIPTDPKKQATLMGLLFTNMTANGVDIREQESDLLPWDTTKDSQLKTSDYKPVTLKDWTLQHADSIFDKGTPPKHKAPNNVDTNPPGGGGDSKWDFSDLSTWDKIYAYKAKIHPNDKDANEHLTALDAHVRKLQEAKTLN